MYLLFAISLTRWPFPTSLTFPFHLWLQNIGKVFCIFIPVQILHNRQIPKFPFQTPKINQPSRVYYDIETESSLDRGAYHFKKTDDDVRKAADTPSKQHKKHKVHSNLNSNSLRWTNLPFFVQAQKCPPSQSKRIHKKARNKWKRVLQKKCTHNIQIMMKEKKTFLCKIGICT